MCAPEIDVPFRTPLSSSGSAVEDMVRYEDVRLFGNTGTFDGVKSRVRLATTAQSPYDRPLVMRFAYREAQELKEPQALISSSKLWIYSFLHYRPHLLVSHSG